MARAIPLRIANAPSGRGLTRRCSGLATLAAELHIVRRAVALPTVLRTSAMPTPSARDLPASRAKRFRCIDVSHPQGESTRPAPRREEHRRRLRAPGDHWRPPSCPNRLPYPDRISAGRFIRHSCSIDPADHGTTQLLSAWREFRMVRSTREFSGRHRLTSSPSP